MYDKCIFQLFRDENSFEFSWIDNSAADMHDSLKLANQEKNLFWKECFATGIIQEFSIKLRDAFGEIYDKFLDAILYRPLPQVINLNKISFTEFTDIIYGSYIDDSEIDRVINLSQLFKDFLDNDFLRGLTFNESHSDINLAVSKPYIKKSRTRFRPIIQFNVDGSTLYYSTPYMFQEAMEEICANLLPFNDIPEEWSENPCIVKYANEQFQQHDKWLENLIFDVIEQRKMQHKIHVKAINNISLQKASAYIEDIEFPNCFVGEIDFIAIDYSQKIVYVIDAKLNKTRYHFLSFATDKSHFTDDKGYDQKLSFKVDWIRKHLSDVGKMFKNNSSDFHVQGVFVTETFTYYSLQSIHPIIPISSLEMYCFNTRDKLCFLRSSNC